MAEKEVKLHELLSVEGQLKGQAQHTRGELATTFEKKRHLFEEKVTVFTPKAEGEREQRDQHSSLQTTVHKELDWIRGIWAKALDVSFTVQAACQAANADVELEDGTVIMRGVPILALLELEKRVHEMKELVSAVPTLDPAKQFEPDPGRGKGVFRAREVAKTRTAKVQEPIVLYHATPEHPAQTQIITKDVVVGTLQEQEWSGLVTPAEKADMITRAEELLRAVKRARMRANVVPVPEMAKDGDALLRYVFDGK